jgi:hypothetical protein
MTFVLISIRINAKGSQHYNECFVLDLLYDFSIFKSAMGRTTIF